MTADLTTMTYERDGRIARITLDRPERGNGITAAMPRELAACVERANLDPEVHVIALAGNGTGFCGGYDLVESAEGMGAPRGRLGARRARRIDPFVMAKNHDPAGQWDPVTDYQMMSRNVRGFMSLFHSEKPTVCKVHGFCVAGGTDMALCSDLLVIEDRAKIGYPPARVWGVPTTALWAHRVGPARAKRLLLTGDSLTGTEAVEWGLAIEAAPAAELDERFESLLERIARVPINQLVMHKLLVNQALYAQGLHATQVLGTFFDGIARHTPEGFAFQQRAAEAGFKEAVRERDEPFGDFGSALRSAALIVHGESELPALGPVGASARDPRPPHPVLDQRRARRARRRRTRGSRSSGWTTTRPTAQRSSSSRAGARAGGRDRRRGRDRLDADRRAA